MAAQTALATTAGAITLYGVSLGSLSPYLTPAQLQLHATRVRSRRVCLFLSTSTVADRNSERPVSSRLALSLFLRAVQSLLSGQRLAIGAAAIPAARVPLLLTVCATRLAL